MSLPSSERRQRAHSTERQQHLTVHAEHASPDGGSDHEAESADDEESQLQQQQHHRQEDWSQPPYQQHSHHSSASTSPRSLHPSGRYLQKSFTARNLRPRETTPRRHRTHAKDDSGTGVRDTASQELTWVGRLIGANSSTLWLFTACQILIFYDRGMVAGFLPSVQRDIGGLSDTEAGVLGSGFIFGYMLACPLFAFFSKSISPYKLMALGLFLWSAATLACGLSTTFVPLLTARILTGVGEASFAGLAPTCIDDVAPMKHRTIWLSFFFAGIPLGSAAGYVSGGYFAKAGWHIGFLLESGAMLPLVLIVFLWPSHEPTVLENTEGGATGGAAAGERKGVMRRTNSWARMPRPGEEEHRAGQSQRQRYAQYGSTEEQTLLPSPPADSFAQPRLIPAQLGEQSGHFARSTSTPGLKRLEGESPSPSAGYRSLGQQQQQSVGDEEDEKHSGNSTNLADPTIHSTASSTSSSRRGSQDFTSPSGRVSRVRTPRAMDRAYITPDPSNPFHVNAGGSTAAASTNIHHIRVKTPGQEEQRAYHHQMDLAAIHADALATPTAHLPSPSSFNPHYAARSALTRRTQVDANGRPLEGRLQEAHPEEDMFVTDIITLLTDGVYIVVVLGYAALAFVIGALSFWGPVDFAIHLHIGLGRSTKMIGAITFVCGLGGTFAGGWVMDKRGGGKGIFAVISALELCCVFTTLAIGFAMAAVSATDLTVSMTCLALADFFLFATGAPVNASLLSVAPKNMRSLAMAMSILLMHALGDLPSPFLMGLITDQVGSITLALMCLCGWLLWTVFFWALGVYLARKRAEAFKVQLEHDMSLPISERSALLARRGSTGSFLASRPEFLDQMQARRSLQRPYQYYDTTESVTQPYPHSAFVSNQPSANAGSSQQQPNRVVRKSRSQAATPPPNRHRSALPVRLASPSTSVDSLPVYTTRPDSTVPIYDAEGRIVGFFATPTAGQTEEAKQGVGGGHHASVSWAPLPKPSPSPPINLEQPQESK